MRVITKRFLITFLSLVLGLTVAACGNDTSEVTTPNDSVIPEISNPDEIFISTDDYDVTYEDLYEEVKKNDGLNQLLLMVDTVLLSEYIPLVTQDQVDDKVKELTYGTDDDEEIAAFTEEEQQEAEDAFNNSLYLLGYSDNAAGYVTTMIAREMYAEEQITDESNSEETWYVDAERVRDYYESYYFEDINSIIIRFNSESDAKNVLRDLNLVAKNGDLLLYIGETPLENVPSSRLDETNTRSLTNDELLNYYLVMYNIVYSGYKDVIDEDITYAEATALDVFTYTREDLVNVNSMMANFLFSSLGSYTEFVAETDDTPFYTYQPLKYALSSNNYYYMLLNLDRQIKADVEDFEGDKAALETLIGADVYSEIVDKLIESSMSSSTFANNRMVELRAENDFVIYDYFMSLDYTLASTDYEGDEFGHETIVASFGEEEITADELLTFCLNINAPIYTIYAAQTKAVIASHFEDLYCNETSECFFDVDENTSELMATHRSDALAAKEEFESGYYAAYYEYEEYLYLAYGVKSNNQLLSDYYVKSTLRPYYIFDEIIKNDYESLDVIMELMQGYIDKYFSFDVNHILIYVDRDEDGSPDDFNQFYDELEDTTEFDQKLADLETAIRLYLEDDENTLESFGEDYQKAERDDLVWGEFIGYGFYVKVEDLGETTFKTADGSYEEGFVDGLSVLKTEYEKPENEDEAYLLSPELVKTSYGMHLIKVEKGSAYEMPNGQFAMTYDVETGDPLYLEDLVNLTEDLTLEQVMIYAQYRFIEIASDSEAVEEIYGIEEIDMPASLLKTFTEFLSELYDAYYVVGYLNAITGQELLEGNFQNSISAYCNLSETAFNTRIQNIIDIYMEQIFIVYDVRDSE
ncbi:hypothetical protein ACAG96_03900 [Candidatus Izemoplasma sp. B36]|uniref:hypothetical protein n=1 Tax=Candidatus Izemoplasma sp. B36 TaxID=3242468 RepID=UPI003557EB8C